MTTKATELQKAQAINKVAERWTGARVTVREAWRRVSVELDRMGGLRLA